MINNIAKDILLNTQFLESKWQIEKGTKLKSDKKSIGFRFPDGREFALDRTNANEIKIWIEDIGAQPPKIFHSEFKKPTEGRNSSLRTTAPKIAGPNKRGLGGNPAYAIYLKNVGELREFLRWYSSSSSPLVSDIPPLESTRAGSVSFESAIASENKPFPGAGANSIRQPMSDEELQTQLDRRSEIGVAGELIALKFERQRVGAAEVGCPDPEYYVKHIALTDVGRGYDIESTWAGHERCIEVKSSTSSGNDIFMSDNEWTVLEALGKKAWLYRVIVNKNGGDGEVVLRLNDPISKIPKDNISTAVWRVRLPRSDE